MKAARPGEAIASVLRALDLEPGRADARYNLANAQRSAGDAPGAVRTYRALLADHPDHHGGWNMLGIALSGRGDLEGAVHAFERAVQLQPQSPRAHLNLGQALRRQGFPEAAARQFQRTRELDPGGDAGRQASQLLDE